MSRFSDDYDEEFPNQGLMQWSNEERSLKGRKGQKSLRELEAALLAMPEKRLIEGNLIDPQGGVCVMGALALHKGVEMTKPEANNYEEEFSEKTERVAKLCGVPRLVAVRAAWMNDEGVEQRYEYPKIEITPEIRYERMLAWVQKQIAEKENK